MGGGRNGGEVWAENKQSEITLVKITDILSPFQERQEREEFIFFRICLFLLLRYIYQSEEKENKIYVRHFFLKNRIYKSDFEHYA